MSTVFSDLTVLDLSQDVAGPYCARLLADFGADVIKVESMTGDSGRSRTVAGPGSGSLRSPGKASTASPQ